MPQKFIILSAGQQNITLFLCLFSAIFVSVFLGAKNPTTLNKT